MHNPYTPPTATVGDIDVPNGSRIKAVLAGLAVDIGGSLLFGFAYIMIYSLAMAGTGADDEQIAASLTALTEDPWFDAGGTAIGFLFSALGGYVCARIARHAEYRLGAIVAAVSIAFGLIVGTGEDSPIREAALIAAAFASTLAGTWIGASRNARDRMRRQRLAQQGQIAP